MTSSEIIVYTGVMCSGKTKALLEKAERLKIMDKDYKIFYPIACSNGEKEAIYSRAGLRESAVSVESIHEILEHINPSDNNIIIDEIQFFKTISFEKPFSKSLCLSKLMQFFEKESKNVYIAGLETDFANNPFYLTQTAITYATKVYKLKAVCMICKKENASKNYRERNGKPCLRNEPVLIERTDKSVEYLPICASCYHDKYKEG